MLTFRGSAVHSLQDKVYDRQPGTVMLFNHHESRDLKGASHKRGFHCLWLHFFSRECLTYNSNSCDAKGRYFQEIPTGMKSGEGVTRIMETWDQHIAEPKDKLRRELLHHLLAGTFLEILGDKSIRQVESHQQKIIVSVQSYIQEHLGEDLSLPSLAQIAGYSSFFFHRMFVRHTGQTPVRYINILRLERAKELLQKNYRVQAVAESVGFASLSYFHSFFKKEVGISPRAWSMLRRPLPIA